MKHEQSVPDRNRLSWQCRRGMRELDELLMGFLARRVDNLTSQQTESFDLLLSYPDQILLDLLLGNSVASDPLIATIVQKIRSTPFD